MNLTDDDKVVGMVPVTEGGELLVISEKGMGKRSSVEEYRQQNRGGKGLITYRISDKTGPLVGCTLVDDSLDLLMITDTGMIIRVAATEIPTLSRATSGVKLMRSNGASVVDFTVTEHEEPEEEQPEEEADA
jgi:DNA gyrase subunit A